MTQTNQPSSNWSYSYSNDWGKKFGQCRKRTGRTAPINIDTSKVSPCSELCRLSINYNPSNKCYLSLTNDNPTITFDPVSLINFKREFYFLRRMTIHQPSMHTINGGRYDMEVMLYHQKNKTNFGDGGVIFSILLKKGVDYGSANEFLNEFINQLPTQETKNEKEIDVSSEWNPLQLLPENKSFFYYDGALPYPPCDMKWTIVVFEEIVSISANIIETVKFMLSGIKNIRPIQPLPPSAVVFYNNAIDFERYDIKETDVLPESALKQSLNLRNNINKKRKQYYNERLYYIKGAIVLIVFILMIILAVKIAKYIIKNDYLNKFMLGQLQKRMLRNQTEASEAQMEQAVAQGQMSKENMAAMMSSQGVQEATGQPVSSSMGGPASLSGSPSVGSGLDSASNLLQQLGQQSGISNQNIAKMAKV
jgi:carbonic anhydrase